MGAWLDACVRGVLDIDMDIDIDTSTQKHEYELHDLTNKQTNKQTGIALLGFTPFHFFHLPGFCITTIGTGTVNPLFLTRLEVDSLSYFRLGHDYGTAHTYIQTSARFFLSLVLFG